MKQWILSLTLGLSISPALAWAQEARGEAAQASSATINQAHWTIEGSALSLQEAISVALDSSPNIALQDAVRRIARLEVDAVNTSYRPTIQLSSSVETSTGAGYVMGSQQLSGGSERTTATSLNASLSASQLIWDFGATSAQRRAARARIEASDVAGAQIERDIVYAVVQNYLNAGAALEQFKVAQKALEAENIRARQIEGYVEVGLRAPIDLANARSSLAAAEARVIEAKMNYDLAVVDLRAAMGVIDDETPLKIEFTTFDTAALEKKSFEELRTLAMEQRGDFQEQRASEIAAREYLRAARTDYYPTLNAVAGVSDSLVINQSNRWNAYIGVRFNWLLYGGGSTQVQVRQREAEIVRIAAQTATFEQSLGAEIRRATSRIEAAGALLATHNARVENAQKQLELAEGRYRNGLGNIVEVADAQQNVIQAEYNRISAELSLSLARASLVAAIADW